MCHRHYDAKRRHGSPYAELRAVPPKRTPEERFWAFVVKGPGCWGWTAHTSHGYGKLTIGIGQQEKAHRFSFVLHHGPIPDGMHVLHTCDNRACCNPEHLFLGVQADNTADMMAKGRGRYIPHRGSDHGMARLTEEAARAIRASTGPARIVAKQFDCSESNVYMIRGRHSWKHIK